MASIHKRRLPDGGYFYEIDFRFRGQRFRRSCKTSDKKVATTILNDISARIARGTFSIEVVRDNDMALGQMADDYIETHSKVEKSASTVAIDRRALDRLIEFAGKNTTVRLITKTKAEKFRAWMLKEKGLGRTTVNMDMRSLRATFNWAKEPERKFIDDNPFDKIRQLSVDARRPRYMVPVELHKFFKFLRERNTRYARAFELYLRVLLHLGSRRTETLELRWKHIDIENRFLSFDKTKNDDFRSVPIGDELLELLVKMKADNPKAGPDDLLFHYAPTSASRAFRQFAKLAGLPPELHLHGTRHTYATMKATQGVPLLALKDLLGHQKIETTMQYAKILPDALRVFQNQGSLKPFDENKVEPLIDTP